jgi:hypothetical protein
VIPGALHGIAFRAGSMLVPLPRARRWLALVSQSVAAFRSGDR